MYWINLALFALIVFVPSLIRDGFYIFNKVQTQEFVILLLGSLVFSIFLLMERNIRKSIAEKSKIQSQINSMTRDLKHSYSYIGEINRKLDILENIALGYPETSKLTHRSEMELYDSIMEAIRLFGKSDDFALRFIGLPNFVLLKEIKSKKDSVISFSMKGRELDVNYLENEEFIVITSPKMIDNIFSYIVIKKKTVSQKMEDIELMKTIAAQALFIFMFMKNKKHIKCVL